MTSDQGKQSRARETPRPGRQPYVKPAFRHEQVFETMALACGKISGTQAACRSSRKTS